MLVCSGDSADPTMKNLQPWCIAATADRHFQFVEHLVVQILHDESSELIEGLGHWLNAGYSATPKRGRGTTRDSPANPGRSPALAEVTLFGGIISGICLGEVRRPG